MIHKRIIDAAAEQPNASIEAIANSVPGASTNLVERVLDEYGDPADTTASLNESDTTEPQDSSPTSESTTPPANTDESTESQSASELAIELADLTPKRRETLQAIYDHPEASQRELAEQLGVTAATISQRVNAIDDFDWTNRSELVTPLFEDQTETAETITTESTTPARSEPPTDPSTQPVQTTASDGGTTTTMTDDTLSALHDRLHSIEEALEHPPDHDATGLNDPELAAKVIHACMESDAITTDEELELIKSLID